MLRTFTTLICLFIFLHIQAQDGVNRRYVNINNTNLTQDGTTWETASTDLQAMIDALSANGGEIWVAQGTYLPSRTIDTKLNTDRHKTFLLTGDIKIYGGFKGTETALDARDWHTNKTILSGDLGNGENVLHVVTSIGQTPKACLDGFTVQGGNADVHTSQEIENPPHSFIYNKYGGGVYVHYSSLLLNHLIITENKATTGGGGIYLKESESLLVNCLLYKNSVPGTSQTEDNGTGGGLYSTNSMITLINVTITENTANHYGAGIDMAYSQGNSTHLNMYNSIVWGNTRLYKKDNIPECENFFINKKAAASITNSLFTYADKGDCYALSNINGKGSKNILDGQPSFVDKKNCNYRLKGSCVAIDKGNNSHIENKYLYGLGKNARIIGDFVDLGAYEYKKEDEIPLPTASFGGNAYTCAGEPASLVLSLTGSGPWKVTYNTQGSSAADKVVTIPANKPNYPLKLSPANTTTYVLKEVTDKNKKQGTISNETATVYVQPLPDPGTITGGDQVYVGDVLILKNEVAGGKWFSDNPSIAQVDENTGEVRGITKGRVQIGYLVETNKDDTDPVGSAGDPSLPLCNASTFHGVTVTTYSRPDPIITASLQWSVSITSALATSFVDVKNNTETSVAEGTPVYLQIRPVVNIPEIYDSWEINYTATPAAYPIGMEAPLDKDLRYDFYEGKAHLLPGTYVYTATQLILYKEGKRVKEFAFNDPASYSHTITIHEAADPDPSPWIAVGPIAGLCPLEKEFRIPFFLDYTKKQLEYTLVFSDEAQEAGFEDVTTFNDLPADLYLSVPVNKAIRKGNYSGNIMLRIKGDPSSLDAYPFEVNVLDIVRITQEPVSIHNYCEGDGFVLTVEATGENLKYQWYHQDKAIEGATTNQYEAILTKETEGIYYVTVAGDCGAEISEKVSVSQSRLLLSIKWNDVLYIKNTTQNYLRFQWYKNGQAIAKNGTAIYYTDPQGMQGRYSVRAYYGPNDTDYDQSCEYVLDYAFKAASVSVYPAIVEQNMILTIETQAIDDTYVNALIEIFDLSGRKVYASYARTNKTEIPVTMTAGSYILHISATNGKKTVKKIIVK